MRQKYFPKPIEASGADPSRRVFTSPPLEIHLSRSADRFECIQLKEPELIFGENHRCVDPRTGLTAYGPYGNAGEGSSGQLRVGIVGTSQAIEKTFSMLQEISRPIEQDSNLDSVLHPSFPGLNSGKPFSVDVVTQPSWRRSINAKEWRLAEECGDSIAKFGMLRELFGAQIGTMGNPEPQPNIVICAATPRMGRSLMNAACAQSLPIEILRDGKFPHGDGAPEDKATQAWNLAVRLLFKAGLTPWRPADAAGDTCFLGVSFYSDVGNAASNKWTSFTHLVTDLGHGFVLKGDTFEWNSNKGMEEVPHLEEDQAANLMSRALEFYVKRVGRRPRKVVVHKTSPYNEAERVGFGEALREIKQHALVSVCRNGVFFLRPGREPVFRGAAIPLGEKTGLVYLSGYIPFLRCCPGSRLPQPMEITENWGSLSFQEAARDLLRLTKLNWGTADFCTEVPVTLSDLSQAREIFNILANPDIVLDDRH